MDTRTHGKGASSRQDPGEIRLEPLGPRHTDTYERLFRGDPQIAALAQLPRLQDRAATDAWIRDGARANGWQPFAIEHVGRGMVGAAALVGHGPIGTFWLWIGAPHRNRGLGTRALAALVLTARVTRKLAGLFATVGALNGPSRRVLGAVGFRETGLALLPRWEGLRLYAEGHLAAAWDLPEHVAALLSAKDARVRLAATGLPPRRGRGV